MNSPSLVQIHCWICDTRATLSQELAARLAEMQAFFTAHSTHEEGLGVQLVNGGEAPGMEDVG